MRKKLSAPKDALQRRIDPKPCDCDACAVKRYDAAVREVFPEPEVAMQAHKSEWEKMQGKKRQPKKF